MKPSSAPPQHDHVVRIRGVHAEIDGQVLVQRSTENGFRTAAPQKLRVQGALPGARRFLTVFSGPIYSRSETSVTGAEGSVVYRLDRSCAVYQVRFFAIEDPRPPLSLHAPSRSSRHSSGGSSAPSFRQHLPINPRAHPNLHDARRRGPIASSAAFHPSPHAAMQKWTALVNPFSVIRNRETANKLRCAESDWKKVVSDLFSAENAENSLKRMVQKFGLQRVKGAFHAASQPPPLPPGQLLRDLQQRRYLVQSSHQKTILHKITNGENWLFRLPRTEKVATYFEMIRFV